MFKVHETIKEDLKEVGRTMTELSIALEINYDQLSHYLNGRRELPSDTEQKIGEIISGWKGSN